MSSAFRFNRRHSRSRGMVFYRVLELAVAHDCGALPGSHRHQAAPACAAHTAAFARGHPPSLDRLAATRPWRTADLDGSEMETPKD